MSAKKQTDAMAKRAVADSKKSVVARAREKMSVSTSQRVGDAKARPNEKSVPATISVTPPQPVAPATAATATGSSASQAHGHARQPAAGDGASSVSASASAAASASAVASASVALEVDAIPRNARGGVLVDRDELHQAFEFFDQSGNRYITVSDLKERLGVFYQNLTSAEYKYLMNSKSKLTEQELYDLLCDNELTDYDPTEEAFRIYANGSEYLDRDVFRDVLTNLGFAAITEADIQTLIETADVDGDGKVGLTDFRLMLQNHKKQHNTS